MRCARFLASSLAVAAPLAGAYEPFFEIDSFAHAEPVPIQEFRKDWNAKLERGGDALLHSRIETGVRLGDWRVGYVARMDYELKASDGMAALYHRTKNDLPFTPGETFVLDLRIWHLMSQGVKLARRWALTENLTVEAGLSLLEGRALLHGGLSGFAITAAAARDHELRADVDYRYDEDVLLDRINGAPHGRGYALDFGAAGRLARLAWRVDLRDALGVMEWDAAPVTTATADTDTTMLGPDGFASYSASLTGTEGFRHFHQRIHPRALAQGIWRHDEQWSYGLRLRVTEVGLYPSATLGAARGDWRLEGELLPRERALGLAAGWQGLELRWLADRLDVGNAHVLSVQISARHAF